MSTLTPEEWAEYRERRPRVKAHQGTPDDAEFMMDAFRKTQRGGGPRTDVPDLPPPPPREAPARSLGGRCYDARK